MRQVVTARWFWVTLLFASINAVGLVKILQVLENGPRLRVVSFSPTGEAAPGSEIVLCFNQPMANPAGASHVTFDGLVVFSPAIPGQPTWINGQTLRIEPDRPLPAATRFECRVPAGTVSLLGSSLARDAVFEFQTPPIQLNRIRQTDLDPSGRVRLSLEFSAPVRAEDLKEHLRLTADGTPLAFTVGRDGATAATQRHLNVRMPDPGIEYEYLLPVSGPDRQPNTIEVQTEPVLAGEIAVQITPGLKTTEGEIPLGHEIVCAVPIDRGMSIGEIDTRAHGSDVRIVIRCSQPVDIDQAKHFIETEPKVDFHVERTYPGFALVGPFQPARRYQVKLLKGLRSRRGHSLEADTERTAVVPDLEPRLTFRTHGIYLPARSRLLPLEAVNVPGAEVEIEEIYPNNLVPYMRDCKNWRSPEDCGRVVARKTLAVANRINEAQTIDLDLKEILGDDRRGAYRVRAQDPQNRWREDQQLALITDMGISVKRSSSDLLVWVNSLATGQPVPGATVSVFTRTNQKVLEMTTGSDGLAHCRDASWDGDRSPFAVVVVQGRDSSFLDITGNSLDLSAFDVTGRPHLRRGHEAFVHSERGVYRPGENVHLNFIVRGPDLAVPTPFPVVVDVMRPDGRDFRSFSRMLSAMGCGDLDIPLPDYALTGRYSVRVKVPQAASPLGETTFQVEEFVPDRMKVQILADEKRFTAGETLVFRVKATHLFGSPAAGRRIQANCTFSASTFEHPSWKDYAFGDRTREFPSVPVDLGEVELDRNGEQVFSVAVPTGIDPPSSLEAVFAATVKEIGGRSVSTTLSRDVDTRSVHVGLRSAGGECVDVGRECQILCAAVHPDGTPAAPRELQGELSRITWNTVLHAGEDEKYRYESEKEAHLIQRFTCTTTEGTGTAALRIPDTGQYEVRVRDPETGASACMTIHGMGRGYVPWAKEKPDHVELVPDRTLYPAGGVATVLLKSPFAGHALVTVETDRVHWAKVVVLEENTRPVEVPCDASWGQTLYCSAVVLRPGAKVEDGGARRAFGTVPLSLDWRERQLKVDLDAPASATPAQPLRVRLRVSNGHGAGLPAEVTLAAVDEGICQLTRFESPDPFGFFFGRRCLAVETSDMYSLLMPEIARPVAVSDSAPGGDSDTGYYDPRRLNPMLVKNVRTVSLWQSRTPANPDGWVDAVLPMPAFSGQLRLMAVAASAGQVGSAESFIEVRQPLMVRSSCPRFLAPNDEFVIPVTVLNGTGRSGAAQVELRCDGAARSLGETRGTVELECGREDTLYFRARAAETLGVAQLHLRAELDGLVTEETHELAVRPPAGLQSLGGAGQVKAGTSLRLAIPGDWVPGTERCRLTLSSMPAVSLGRSISYLVHYPYGCLEQTTSQAFPLLYLNDLAAVAEPEFFKERSVESFVQAAIHRVLSMVTPEDGLGPWPGYRASYPWGTAYAAHFLIEARKAGYDVPSRSLDGVLEYLQRCLAASNDGTTPSSVKAYACLDLALAGKPNRSWMFRLYEQRAELPVYSRFQLAVALFLSGETKMAQDLVEGTPLPDPTGESNTDGVLHSPTREAAILLSARLDMTPGHPQVAEMAKRLADSMRDGQWATTQENSFALLALGKYARSVREPNVDYTAEVRAGGEPLATVTHRDRADLRPANLGGQPVEIAVRGTGTLYYTWSAEGVPASGTVDEFDRGIRVRRRVLSRSGMPVPSDSVPHGEIVVVEITLANDQAIRNVVVSDLLPAGLEIENPEIATSEKLPWAKDDTWRPDRVEMRDDRLLLFADRCDSGTRTFRYIARAVTEGEFRWPPIAASCMYRPEVGSVHGGGTLRVVRR